MSEPPSIDDLLDADALAAGPPDVRWRHADDPAVIGDDGEDLVALAGAAASRFADEAAAAPPPRRPRTAAGRPLPACATCPGAGCAPRTTTARRAWCCSTRRRCSRRRRCSASACRPGWVAVPVPDAEMAVRRPEPVDGFLANVLVRVRRTPPRRPSTTTSGPSSRSTPRPTTWRCSADEVAADVTTPVRRVAVRFPGPTGGCCVARHLLVYVPATEHVANIVSVVGTWPEAAPAGVAEEMEAVVRVPAPLHPPLTRGSPPHVELRSTIVRMGRDREVAMRSGCVCSKSKENRSWRSSVPTSNSWISCRGSSIRRRSRSPRRRSRSPARSTARGGRAPTPTASRTSGRGTYASQLKKIAEALRRSAGRAQAGPAAAADQRSLRTGGSTTTRSDEKHSPRPFPRPGRVARRGSVRFGREQ